MNNHPLELWDICEARHRSNPESRAAFDRAAPNIPHQRAKVLEAVKNSGDRGLTCRELCSAWGCMMNQVSGRFSELKAAGLISKKGVRDGCAVYQ